MYLINRTTCRTTIFQLTADITVAKIIGAGRLKLFVFLKTKPRLLLVSSIILIMCSTKQNPSRDHDHNSVHVFYCLGIKYSVISYGYQFPRELRMIAL